MACTCFGGVALARAQDVYPSAARDDFYGQITVNGKPPSTQQDVLHERSTTHEYQLFVRDEDYFRIRFKALALRGPTVTHLRYRMEGIDKDWIEAATDQSGITYSCLPGGEYLFHLEEGNRSGTWSEAGGKLLVHVSRPWWRRRSTEIICGAIIFFVLWIWRRQSFHHMSELIRIRVEERVCERTRVAREIEDKVLQGSQGLILKLDGLKLQLDSDDPNRQAFEEALTRAEETLGQVRDMVETLRSPPASFEAQPDLKSRISRSLRNLFRN